MGNKGVVGLLTYSLKTQGHNSSCEFRLVSGAVLHKCTLHGCIQGIIVSAKLVLCGLIQSNLLVIQRDSASGCTSLFCGVLVFETIQ